MTAPADIWAVIPVKELDGAKQRLAPLLSPTITSMSARRWLCAWERAW